MKKVFMFILPSGAKTRNISKTIGSIKSLCGNDFIECTEVKIEKFFAEGCDWYGYIYDNERLDKNLARALPVFFEHPFDFIVCMKRVVDKGELRGFSAPRFFKYEVDLIEGSLIPKDSENLRSERSLDGWILEDARL